MVNVDISDVVEGQEVMFTVQLDRLSSLDAVIQVRSVGGTATPIADHNFEDQQVLIPAGQTSAQLPIVFLADGVFEGEETLILEFEALQGPSVAQPRLQVSIADSDQPPGISIDNLIISENAGRPIPLIIETYGTFGTPLILDYVLQSGSAQIGEDVQDNSGQILIPPGTAESQILLTLVDDQIPEGAEFFEISVTSAASIQLPDTPVRIDIIDNEFFTNP